MLPGRTRSRGRLWRRPDGVKFYTIQSAVGHLSFLTDQTLAFSALLHTLMLAAELSLFGLGVPARWRRPAGLRDLPLHGRGPVDAHAALVLLNWKEAKWQKTATAVQRIFR